MRRRVSTIFKHAQKSQLEPAQHTFSNKKSPAVARRAFVRP
jgi:hypothetical protein